MPEKFVVKKGTTGKFRFSLVGRNGKVIASSETYNTKAACLNGIKAVQAGAARAVVEDQTTKAWADEQTRLKSATKAAAGAAKKAIKAAGKTAPAKTAARTTRAAKGAATTAVRTAKAAPKTAKAAARASAR